MLEMLLFIKFVNYSESRQQYIMVLIWDYLPLLAEESWMLFAISKTKFGSASTGGIKSCYLEKAGDFAQDSCTNNAQLCHEYLPASS